VRIAFTYDLREDYIAQGWDPLDAAEFDDEETISGIEAALQELGHEVLRVGHAKALAARLLAGERWEMVFNIAEGHGGFGREALVPALLEHFGIPCTFSDPLICAVTLHKGATKHWLRNAGIATADFAVIDALPELESLALPYPLFVKPVAEGSSKGVDADALVRSPEALRTVCQRLLERFSQPVLVERYLPGREVTIGILGSGDRARSVGVLEVELVGPADAAGYTFANKKEWRDRVRYRLAEDRFARDAAQLALSAHRALGARDASRVDVRADDAGRPNFIEINPLPGLNPTWSDLPILWRLGGGSYSELLAEILESAARRLGSPAACMC
jgi:D-alanine-D-alanine ligase